MAPKDLLPKRVVNYIHDVGVRSLDHLANNLESPAPGGVESLVNSWKAMSTDEKERFIERVGVSVVEVVAASTVLPLGLKLGKRAAKAAKKAIKKQTKKIKKAAKSTTPKKKKTTKR
jgi:hypothetical protein